MIKSCASSNRSSKFVGSRIVILTCSVSNLISLIELAIDRPYTDAGIKASLSLSVLFVCPVASPIGMDGRRWKTVVWRFRAWLEKSKLRSRGEWIPFTIEFLADAGLSDTDVSR
jgi:hypothetical protein